MGDYNKRIKQEDETSLFYQKSIEEMNQTMSVITRGNKRKERRLLKIEEKIQTLNPLKSFLSTMMSKKLNMNNTALSRKSSMKSVSSKKPS